MSEIVQVEKKNSIAYVRMNRPDKRNALSAELKEGLISALKEADNDENVRVIILSGEGKSFCAGGDIGSMTPGASPLQILKKMKETTEITNTIFELDKYVISAVHGHAAGAGFSVALASDFIVAQKDAVFISSFGNIGLVPDLGLIKLLTEKVPEAVAKEWISSSRPIPAQALLERGLVSRIAENDPIAEATEFAQFIVNGPPVANKFVKYLVNRSNELSHELSMMQESIIQSIMFQTEDTKEGITAFREKRSPNFKGR